MDDKTFWIWMVGTILGGSLLILLPLFGLKYLNEKKQKEFLSDLQRFSVDKRRKKKW